MLFLLLVATHLAEPLLRIRLEAPLSGEPLLVSTGLLAGRPAGLPAGRCVRVGRGAGLPVVATRHGRWWVLDALLPPAPGRQRLVPSRRSPPGTLPAPLTTRAVGDALIVESGSARWTLQPDGRLQRDGWTLEWAPACGMARSGWRVSRRSPLALALVWSGLARAGSQGAELRADVALTLAAGSDRARLGLHVTALQRCALSRGLGVRISRSGGLGLEDAAGGVLRARRGDLLAVRAGRHWMVDRRTWSARWPGSLVCVPRGPALRPLNFGVFESFELRRASLLAQVRPRGEVLAAGEGRFLRLAVNFAGVRPQAAACVLPGRVPRRAGGGTLLPVRRRTAELAAGVESRVDAWLADPRHGLLRNGVDAGDWRMGPDVFGNHEYDTLLGLLLDALRRPRGRSFAAALGVLDHLLGHDRDAQGSGLFFPHGAGHRLGPTEVGHHWIEGVLLAEQWLLDPLLELEVERLLADQLRAFRHVDLEQAYPRSLGWGLLALSAACIRTRSPSARSLLRRWRRFLLRRQQPRGILALVPWGTGGRRFLENPFVQGGIILPALARSRLALRGDGVRGAMDRLRSFLLAEAVGLEGGETVLASRLLYARDRGRVLARWPAAAGEHAALFLAGCASVRPASRLPATARRLLAELPGQLQLPHRRYPGRELSILLRSLPYLGQRP